ncbi:aldehyde dehydrogenase (NADP(+)) [Tropicibacter sp. Alg240-R139]|uniref:aldehyde dehydrogenase (NADP(+)) n=1 Tax=Tropicibacter sp. Alg240-R139 TaxID=2305991 RepID=UPI0013E0A12C|nr:aldehyde dehydrogenase (NADP(+)) [Tropicibacter sp. Alg240-R139]
MKPTGRFFVGDIEKIGVGEPFKGVDTLTGEHFGVDYFSSSEEDIFAACKLADAAFDEFRSTSPSVRAKLLESIAKEIDGLGDALVELASRETGLPAARITGERNRTTGQLRMFAKLLLNGGPIEANIVPADLERRPLPRPDLRRQFIGVGPVAVFGASNFPLAFSVAGGDTASALAAGCPVVVKAHPAHPGTSELVARAVLKAVRSMSMHQGIFSMVAGSDHDIGKCLVAHPAIKSVGFTGSQKGGLALVTIAQNRPEPIPVHAEMGSVNPVFLMPGALSSRPVQIAKEFIASLTASAGQFCTNPGLVVAVDGPDLERFLDEVRKEVSTQEAQPMLTTAIHGNYEAGVARSKENDSVEVIARGVESDTRYGCVPTVLRVEANSVEDNATLVEENFGASSVVIVCQNSNEMLEFARKLEGQLTATLHLERSDWDSSRKLIPVLEKKAGRIVSNGWPTGVEVNTAIIHGGPYPSSSDGRTTSVGPLAIRRFLRPVSYQNFPQELLPEALRDSNPWSIAQEKS